MNRIRSLFIKHKTLVISLGFLVLFSFSVSYAAPLYTPGQTLDPQCAPGTTDCTVSVGGGSASPWDTVTGGINFAGGNVGIGTTTPGAALDLEGDGTLLAVGTDGSGAAVPNLGTGTRMEWIPSASAFRAGYVESNEWNSSNVGDASVAFGDNTIASGIASAALGDYTVASGYAGIASGYKSVASGEESTAFGNNALASGLDSVSMGLITQAIGDNTAAFGSSTTANSYLDAVFGENNVGGGTDPSTWIAADPLFEVGDGDADSASGGAPSDAFSILKNGNVGIDTATPQTELDLEGDGTVLAAGTFGSGAPVPDLGAGSRMEWIPSIGAFRAGLAVGTEWDSANVGLLSTAFGEDTTASGQVSTAFGAATVASNEGSTAFGVSSVASGAFATTFGLTTTASGTSATAFGSNSVASGNGSNAFGIGTASASNASTAIGSFNVGNGAGDAATWVSTDPLFEIGNGNPNVPSPVRSNAFTVLKNAHVGINTATPATELDLEGDGAILAKGAAGSGVAVPDLGAGTRMEWIPSNGSFRAGTVFGTQWDNASVGQYSTAFGLSTIASGQVATAFGGNTTASNTGSTAFGVGTIASGNYSTTFGQTTTASAANSTAFGVNTTASGNSSTTFGSFTTAAAYNSIAIGIHNIGGGNGTNWIPTDPLLEVGNGTGLIGDPNKFSDALAILKNGNTGINTGTTALSSIIYSLQVGSSAITGADAQFTNSTGSCTINPTTSSLTCSSDMRLKDNITTLASNTPWSFNANITYDNQDVLSGIMALNPVQYNWKTETPGSPTHPGFIAQEVQQVFPNLVATDPATGLLSLNYTGLIPYTVAAIQEMNFNMTNIDDLTRTNTWRDAIIAWLGDAGNGITNIFSTQVTTPTLCVGTNTDRTCITKAQLDQLLQQQNVSPSTGGSGSSGAPTITPPLDSPTQTPGVQSPEVSTPDVDTSADQPSQNATAGNAQTPATSDVTVTPPDPSAQTGD